MLSNKKVFMSFVWVSIEKFGHSGLNLISILILSRLLVPEDFGLIGVLAIFISISQMIVESGLGSALVKKENPTRQDFSTIFTFNLIVSIVLYIIIFLVVAPLIAAYYDESILSNLIKVLSLSIIFNAFTLIQRVHLLRELKFKQQSLIAILSLLISISISISLAVMGMGVWALVFQMVAYSFFYAIFVFFSVKYYPSFYFSYASFKELFSFGGRIFASSLIQITYRDIFSMIIAKIYNINVAGLYFQSNKLVNFPVSIFRALTDGAVFPVLSKIQDKKEFGNLCRRLNRGVLLVATPLLLSLAFFSEYYVLIVLGNNWIEAIPFMTILSLGALPLIIESISRNMMKAAGRADYILKSEMIKRILGFGLLFLALQFSIEYILWSVVIANMLAFIINMYIVNKITSYTWKSQIKDIFIFMLLSLTSFLVIHLVRRYITMDILLVDFVIKMTCLLFAYFLLGLIFRIEELKILQKKLSMLIDNYCKK